MLGAGDSDPDKPDWQFRSLLRDCGLIEFTDVLQMDGEWEIQLERFWREMSAESARRIIALSPRTTESCNMVLLEVMREKWLAFLARCRAEGLPVPTDAPAPGDSELPDKE
jgi:hypothetical protein